MKKNISKSLYLRYKFQTDLLDTLATKREPIEITDISANISHFKNNKVKSDEFKMMYQEFLFLANLGLCTICDNEGCEINTHDKVIEMLIDEHLTICCMLTKEGIEAVRNRTYESLYISTYLNYRMYKLSIISILFAFVSIIIAIIAIIYPHF